MGETVIQIEAPHFVAGAVLEDGKVWWSAPIIRYMRGWSRNKVVTYCKRKTWHLTFLKDEQERRNLK